MKEITDEQLSILREKLSLCNPLVQSLVMRLDNTEKQLEVWRNDERARCLDVSKLADENTTLRERVKRMEGALREITKHTEVDSYFQVEVPSHVSQIAQAALKEGE